jgi:hypothetical protein
MSSASDLIGVGVPAEVAKRSGYDVFPITTVALLQTSTLLRGAGNKLVQLTSHANTGAVTLPADAGIGDEIIVANTTAAFTAAVFPHSGGNINGGTTDIAAALAVGTAAGSSRRFVKINATRWASWVTA